MRASHGRLLGRRRRQLAADASRPCRAPDLRDDQERGVEGAALAGGRHERVVDDDTLVGDGDAVAFEQRAGEPVGRRGAPAQQPAAASRADPVELVSTNVGAQARVHAAISGWRWLPRPPGSTTIVGVAHVLERGVDDLDAARPGDGALHRADRHQVHVGYSTEDGPEGVGLIGQHALVGDDGDLSFHVQHPRSTDSLARGVAAMGRVQRRVQRVNRRRSLSGPLTSHTTRIVWRSAATSTRPQYVSGRQSWTTGAPGDHGWNGRPSSKHTTQPPAVRCTSEPSRHRQVVAGPREHALLAPRHVVAVGRQRQRADDAAEPRRPAVDRPSTMRRARSHDPSRSVGSTPRTVPSLALSVVADPTSAPPAPW